MGVVDGAKFDREKFAGDLRRAFDAVEANDAAAIVGDVIAVSEDNNLVLPREFGLLTKQAVYLNRYVTTLAPDLDADDEAAAVAAAQRLPPAPPVRPRLSPPVRAVRTRGRRAGLVWACRSTSSRSSGRSGTACGTAAGRK